MAPGKIPLRGKTPENVYIVSQPRRWSNIVQTAGWIKMPLAMEVGLGPGDVVVD